MTTFSQIVREALARELKDDDVRTLPSRLAERLRTELHREGYAVHRVADCVRPGPPPGQPMTREQMIAVGLEGSEQG